MFANTTHTAVYVIERIGDGAFAVYRWWVSIRGATKEAAPVAEAATLEQARGRIPSGMVRFPSAITDGPNVVEAWQ